MRISADRSSSNTPAYVSKGAGLPCTARIDQCQTLTRPVVFTLCLECHNGAGTFGREDRGVSSRLPPTISRSAIPAVHVMPRAHPRIERRPHIPAMRLHAKMIRLLTRAARFEAATSLGPATASRPCVCAGDVAPTTGESTRRSRRERGKLQRGRSRGSSVTGMQRSVATTANIAAT